MILPRPGGAQGGDVDWQAASAAYPLVRAALPRGAEESAGAACQPARPTL